MSDHRQWVLWLADCAARTLPLFEIRHPADPRPRKALQAARDWAGGALTTAKAREAAFAAHAAARAAGDPAAIAAARAAGHAAASAHVARHAPHAASYALKAKAAAGQPVKTERAWQIRRLPPPLPERPT